MSIDILAGFAGRVSLGHGAIFGVATYVVIYADVHAGLSPYLGFLQTRVPPVDDDPAIAILRGRDST